MTMLVTCPICGETDAINLNDEETINYERWQRRELLIQDAFPNRTAAEREQLKTGICSACWDSLFEEYENDKRA